MSTTTLRFTITADGPDASSINRITLRVASVADEGFFGFGEQLTYFNQKGHVLPIVVQEHGVGRGRRILTELIDLFASQGGGNPYISEAVAPHFMTSRLRSLSLENSEYSVFDMRPFDWVVIKVWSGTMSGRILYGETPLDLIESYTEYSGRMRALPDWVHSGVILGVAGGTAAVRAKLNNARSISLTQRRAPGSRMSSCVVARVAARADVIDVMEMYITGQPVQLGGALFSAGGSSGGS